MDSIERPKRHWQNLIHRKCPDCDTKMNVDTIGFKCPNCSFFLKKETMIKILTDPTHAALRFMSEHERDILAKGFEDIGVPPNQFLK